MKYVSIDLETTGLNPDRCQILEIGAVFDDFATGQRKTFSKRIFWDEIVGEPVGIMMNAELIKDIANKQYRNPGFTKIDYVAEYFCDWLRSCGYARDSVSLDPFTPAGKNFGSCDRQFLIRVPNWNKMIPMRHRSLDPAILYMRPDDDSPPSLPECARRAGIPVEEEQLHGALYDATLVADLLRHHFQHRCLS